MNMSIGLMLFACFAKGIEVSETNTVGQAESGLRFIPRAVYPFEVPAEYTDIFITYTLATAGAGRAEAQFQLGAAYATGKNMPLDEVQAARLFRLAAEQGHAMAQFNLALLYANGEGVPQDSDKSRTGTILPLSRDTPVRNIISVL